MRDGALTSVFVELDLIPLVVTLIACLFLGLEYGILVGLATNITFVLYSSARPSVTIERYKMSCGDTFVVAPSKGLQYPAAEFIREMIIKHCDRPNSTVVIDGTYIRGVDATVAKNLKVLAEEILVRNQKVIFWNFKKGVREIIVGVEGKLEAHFRDGSLEEVCRGKKSGKHVSVGTIFDNCFRRSLSQVILYQ